MIFSSSSASLRRSEIRFRFIVFFVLLTCVTMCPRVCHSVDPLVVKYSKAVVAHMKGRNGVVERFVGAFFCGSIISRKADAIQCEDLPYDKPDLKLTQFAFQFTFATSLRCERFAAPLPSKKLASPTRRCGIAGESSWLRVVA